MIGSLTFDALLSLALVGGSALALAGAVVALRSTRRAGATGDTRAAVRMAPYHRLHNLLPATRR